MADSKFYVYQYLTEDGQPYYIGKGCGKRIHKPHTSTSLPPKERRIIIKDGLTNEEAKILEGNLISKFKRKIDGGILDNIKINQWACAVGWKHSDEAKRKIFVPKPPLVQQVVNSLDQIFKNSGSRTQ